MTNGRDDGKASPMPKDKTTEAAFRKINPADYAIKGRRKRELLQADIDSDLHKRAERFKEKMDSTWPEVCEAALAMYLDAVGAEK